MLNGKTHYICVSKSQVILSDFQMWTVEKSNPHSTKSTTFEKVYPGESIQLNCKVRNTSVWIYMWYLKGSEIHTTKFF